MKTSVIIACSISVIMNAAIALAAPQAMVEHPNHNFGTIMQGKKIDHVFVLKNGGDAPLQVKQVRPSCGCTAANVSSPTIAPGHKGEIKTTFDSANFSGTVRKEIAVDTNDPAKPTLTLVLTGKITEEIEINPRQLNLGQVKVDTPKAAQIIIENRGAKPLKLLSLKASSPHTTVTSEKSVLKPGESGRVTMTVTPRQNDRVLSGYVSITTDHPTKQSITVPFYGSPAK